MVTSFNRAGVVVEAFAPSAGSELSTGIAGFVCPAWSVDGASAPPPALPGTQRFTSWADFAGALRTGPSWAAWSPGRLLWASVQGFFANGGQRCWVALYDPAATGDPLGALALGVAALREIDEVDLVCAPSLLALDPALELQHELIRRCEERDDWFLVLDVPLPGPGREVSAWVASLRTACQRPHDAAVYQPWLVPGGDFELPPGHDPRSAPDPVPASGHVAGIFARTDQRVGPHRSPANELLEGVVDLVADVADVAGTNAIRALPGRGIRVWGARTLAVTASNADGNAFIGVRRLLLTLERWLVHALDWTVFETNDLRAWVRIHRELGQWLTRLFERGALRGRSPDEAFYVKCDDENNPADVRAAGKLQVDIGVAPAVPNEFIKIRLVRSAEATTIA